MVARKWEASVLGTALAVGVLAVTAMVTAAPSRADTDSYLNKLHNAGVNLPRGDNEMKEWGWEICALLASGVKPDKVRDQAVYNSGSRPQYGMTVEQANDFVEFAATDLCPFPDGRYTSGGRELP
ncbi:hypothetical protein MINTM001_04240 [Mycobacterium paraintracellulare]|uniref:DUF732 domain-containing protein n=1 Tax=Mycobacterium paraintracellulare TaxID=1138383 RepID=UPI0019282A32|nr:DUF732 domain-containing protein [Mycobacterium paraintracellulare]BCO39285.1 hypothetical protein MINTM001_04240 [Mycobacterium paraintracellulare]